jgi:acyl carrier protein
MQALVSMDCLPVLPVEFIVRGKLRRVDLMDIKHKLKQVIVEDLNLEEMTPEQIRDDEVLFGQGIGLDSLDAVELVVIVKRHFGVEIKDMTEGRKAFASIESLANFIEERLSK